MGTITKRELIDKVAQSTGLKRAVVKQTVHGLLSQIILEMGKGHRLEFRDFGVFEVRHRSARTAQNPKTMQRVEVPAKRTVKFKAGRLMKLGLDNPSAAAAEIAAMSDRDDDSDESSPRPVVRSRALATANGRARHR